MTDLLLLAMVATVATQSVAPPACTAGANPCAHNCENGVIDLTGFKTNAPSTGYYVAQDAGDKYFFMACAALPATLVQCSDSKVAAPVAVQSYGNPAPDPTPSLPDDSCAALGSYSAQTCHSTGTANLTCTYTGGDDPGNGPRTVTFTYACAPTYTPPTASQELGASPPHYNIHFSGPAACAGAASAGGTSWGTLFCILFPVFCGVYVGSGYFYNYKYKELRGIDAVPQLEYWKQVPGLVKDGCKFSYQQTNTFIQYVKEKQQGAPADAGLKRALAENEGGEPSTAYEERGS